MVTIKKSSSRAGKKPSTVFHNERSYKDGPSVGRFQSLAPLLSFALSHSPLELFAAVISATFTNTLIQVHNGQKLAWFLSWKRELKWCIKQFDHHLFTYPRQPEFQKSDASLCANSGCTNPDFRKNCYLQDFN